PHYLYSFPTRRSSDLREIALHVQRPLHLLDFEYRRIGRRDAEAINGEQLAAIRADKVVTSNGPAAYHPFPAIEEFVGTERDELRSEEHTSELQSRENL